jgi:hypothetical protein
MNPLGLSRVLVENTGLCVLLQNRRRISKSSHEKKAKATPLKFVWSEKTPHKDRVDHLPITELLYFGLFFIFPPHITDVIRITISIDSVIFVTAMIASPLRQISIQQLA